jgi:hypothetical protein
VFPGIDVPDTVTPPARRPAVGQHTFSLPPLPHNSWSWFTPAVKSFQHQLNAMAQCLSSPVCFLAMEMGTGKTKVAVDVASAMADPHGGAYKVGLVFCPKTLMRNWANEIKQFGTGLRVVPIEGATEQAKLLAAREYKRALTEPGMTVFIINYDKAWRMIDSLTALKPGIVILDESHKIKTWKAKRTKAIVAAFQDVKIKKICLTGTPITQNLLDLFPQYRFLDPAIIGDKNWYSYRATYCVMGGYQGYQVLGFRNVDKLKAKEIANIDQAMAAAWDAFDASMKPETETSTEKGFQGEGMVDKTKTKKKGQSGNAAHLAIVLKCIEMRCKLLGLNEIQAAEEAQAVVVEVVVNDRSQVQKLLNYQEYQELTAVQGEVVKTETVPIKEED